MRPTLHLAPVAAGEARRTLALCGAAIAAPLIAVAVVRTGPIVFVWIGVLAGVVAVTADMLRAEPRSEHEPGWGPSHRGLVIGVAAWLLMTALVGLGNIVGDAMGAVLAVLAALVAAGRGYRRWGRRDRPRLEPALHGQPGTEEPGTEDLCRQWRHSHTLLTQARDPESAEQVAALRRRCLDELEERDPDAFARWLAAGPHHHDPGQFIGIGPDLTATRPLVAEHALTLPTALPEETAAP